MIQGTFSNSYKGFSQFQRWSWFWAASVALMPGLAPVALGPDSTFSLILFCFLFIGDLGKFLEHLATWVSGHLEALGCNGDKLVLSWSLHNLLVPAWWKNVIWQLLLLFFATFSPSLGTFTEGFNVLPLPHGLGLMTTRAFSWHGPARKSPMSELCNLGRPACTHVPQNPPIHIFQYLIMCFPMTRDAASS